MNDLLYRLDMKEISPLFDECYEKVQGDDSIPDWLTEDFIKEIHKNYGILPTQLDAVLSARAEIVKSQDLVQFSKALYEMLKIDADGRTIFENITFPGTPDGKNLIGVFPMLAHFVQVYNELKGVGIEEDVLKITFSMLDLYLSETAAKRGYPVFSPGGFRWTNLAKCKSLFRIGRFNFEIKKEARLGVYAFKNEAGEIKVLMDNGIKIAKDGFASTDNEYFITDFYETDEYYEGFLADNKTATVLPQKTKLYKSEWTSFYKPGDNIISVHIPSLGSFEPQVVDDCLEKGKDVFAYIFSLPVPETLVGYDFNTLPDDGSLRKQVKNTICQEKLSMNQAEYSHIKKYKMIKRFAQSESFYFYNNYPLNCIIFYGTI